MTGISVPDVGPNCFRTHEYRIAIVQQLIKLPTAKLLMPTRPDERAPRLAPNRLLDVCNRKTIMLTSERENHKISY